MSPPLPGTASEVRDSADNQQADSQILKLDFSKRRPPRAGWISNMSVRPTACEMIAGILKAGQEGRIIAWKDDGLPRDLEPVEQQDGSRVTCCPAHNDHTPSFVVTDSVDERGTPKLLVHCRSGCSQENKRRANSSGQPGSDAQREIVGLPRSSTVECPTTAGRTPFARSYNCMLGLSEYGR
jgi:hypothetical protein